MPEPTVTSFCVSKERYDWNTDAIATCHSGCNNWRVEDDRRVVRKAAREHVKATGHKVIVTFHAGEIYNAE